MRLKPNAVLRSVHRDERGAALYEYALVFPLLCAVVFVIVAMGWWWWSQSVAAIAIHDGARDAAAHHGNLTLGYDTTRSILASHLGRPNAERYEGRFRLWLDGARRSVRGEVHLDHVTTIPFVGAGQLFEVRAATFQRRWDFYGGPPDYWE
ncbi:MAG TPA: pilus assembly protein [Anaerolineae bacterium]|nr:pilus assembly protein [Anaerolineae bacterium]